MWRIGHDHMACFKTTVPDAPYSNVCALDYLDASDSFLHTSGPGHWNDFDMLQVGNAPPDANPITVQFAELATGQPGVHLSDLEGRTEFSIWAMLPAPLFAGNNLSRMSAATTATLTNRDVIAVNQDRLGRPATRVARTDGLMVWTRVLEHGDRALLVVNPDDTTVTATVAANESKLPKAKSYHVRDLWTHRTRTSADGTVDVELAPHAAELVRISTS
jgi:alpha-galactosidase